MPQITEPEISVGMPVLNGEATIARAISDLQAQTFTNFELTICDNASADRTVEIANAIAANDERIKVIAFDERVNVNASFRRALENARAPYFMFAPADDRWYPEFMEENLAALRSDESLTASTGKVAFFLEGRFDRISLGTAPLAGTRVENLQNYLRDPVENARLFSLMRRTHLRDIFPTGTCPGWDFHMVARIIAQGGGFVELPEVLSERDTTPLEAYARQWDAWTGRSPLRVLPFIWLVMNVLRDRRIPKNSAILRSLLHLLWISHSNFAALRMPRWHRTLQAWSGFWKIDHWVAAQSDEGWWR